MLDLSEKSPLNEHHLVGHVENRHGKQFINQETLVCLSVTFTQCSGEEVELSGLGAY